MSEKITENEIERFTIELLEGLGYEYIYAPSISPDSQTPLRDSFGDVILKEKLKNALTIINSTLQQMEQQLLYIQVEQPMVLGLHRLVMKQI